MYVCKKLTVVCFVLCLTACSTYHPLPIKELKSPVEAITGYDDMLVKFSYRQKSYLNIAVGYYSKLYKFSDGAYGSGILATIGGATKSIETTALAGLVGFGATSTPERYQLEKQANNYRSLSKVYGCMYREVLYVEKSVKGLLADYTPFYKKIDQIVSELHSKLIDKQISLPLGGNSIEKLTQIIEKYKEEKIKIFGATQVEKTSIASKIELVKAAKESVKEAEKELVTQQAKKELVTQQAKKELVTQQAKKELVTQQAKKELVTQAKKAVKKAEKELVLAQAELDEELNPVRERDTEKLTSQLIKCTIMF